MNEDHVVLIRSDGSTVYENGYEPIDEWDDEEVFEDDDIDEW